MEKNRKIQILVILTILAISIAAIGISASNIIDNEPQYQQNNISTEESQCQQNEQCLNTEECSKHNCNYEQPQNLNIRPKSGCCKKT